MFFTPFGNKKYEGGKVSFFDWIDKTQMSRVLIEGFAMSLGYKLPFGMLYKPKDKALKYGRMIRNDKEVLEILEHMEMMKWTVMSVYLVMPEITHELQWKVDPTAVPHVPTAPKLKHCVIEELPPNCDVVPDVVGIPVDMNNEVVILSDDDSSQNNLEDDEPDFEDDEDDFEDYPDFEDDEDDFEDHPDFDYNTFWENEGWDDQEVQDAGDDAPPIDIQSQPQDAGDDTPIDQPTTTIAEFESNEEEYEQDLETERNVAKHSDPSSWWGSVTNFCSEGGETNEGSDDGGFESEDDLASLASDDEEGGVKKKTTKEYNPLCVKETFNFEKGMLFASVGVFRKALKDYFLAQNKDFKYISNDQRRVRAICKGTSCKWLIYASRVSTDGTTFRVNTLENTHDCGIVLNSRLANSAFLSTHFLETFRLNPNLHYTGFKEMVSNTKYSKVSKWSFYRAKDMALAKLEGSVAE